ncbi:acetate--CoA ligase family protein [Methylocapsa sp. S129]|uniref:acetate--CoA ligase family protein n=1 Tax=Methylocapsa sp. S129 TaxID=1641869 RepID=UPI00131A9409|nr:acetate--CoA ligase family protein [Methylocapsa sp. S129]
MIGADMTLSKSAAFLTPLLAPRSIAFVGASARPNTPGHDMMRMIRRGGFTGIVHAVNPKGGEIEGYPCVRSLADLPAPPDLAVLSVRNERLEGALAAAIAAGAKAAVIFASGLLPDDGDSPLAQRLARLARAARIPICGPNCMGFYNDLDGVWVCGFPSPRQPAPGSIAFIAHSGSVFGALAHNDPRLRFALAVSPGGEATATVADYIAYAVERPEVKVVGLFLESARDPRGFARALERAAERGVPVVALKVGRTEAAAAGALTHTGALAGSDLAYSALFDRYGVIRVETLDELAATLLLLSTERPVRRGGLVTIGDSGGERELMIDLAERAGVPFAAISQATKAAIAGRLEHGLEAANPLDAWGSGADFVACFTDCLGDLLADSDAALGLLNADLRDGYYLHRGFADAALAAARASDKIVAVATNYTQVRHEALALELTRAGVPVLDGTANALAAVRGAFAYRDFQARPFDPPPSPPAARAADRERARARLRQGAGPLDEATSLSLLEAWGAPAIPHIVVANFDEARRAAAKLGYPVACKTAERGLLHKSDVGGVRLGLTDEQALRDAYDDLAARLGPRALIAPMAQRGVELSLGMIRDPQFGPVVTVGAGGTLVELLDDRRAALAPFGRATARRLLDGLKLRRLLNGYRGGGAVDMERLAEIVALFSVLAAELADLIAEIDVNPLIAGADIVALDALIVAEPEIN